MQARKKITRAHTLLKRGHITLHYQFLKLITHTENLKRRLYCMCEQYNSNYQWDQEQEQRGNNEPRYPDVGRLARTSTQYKQGGNTSSTWSHKLPVGTKGITSHQKSKEGQAGAFFHRGGLTLEQIVSSSSLIRHPKFEHKDTC